MTDRHSGYIVVLADDIREDDAEAVISALRMVKGVLSVEPVLSNPDQRIVQARAHEQWCAMLRRVGYQAWRSGPDSVARQAERD